MGHRGDHESLKCRQSTATSVNDTRRDAIRHHRTTFLISASVVLIAVSIATYWYLAPRPKTALTTRSSVPVGVAIATRQNVSVYLTGFGAAQASLTVGIRPQRGIHDRAVNALEHVGITDVITLLGHYASVAMTLAFYDVPDGARRAGRAEPDAAAWYRLYILLQLVEMQPTDAFSFRSVNVQQTSMQYRRVAARQSGFELPANLIVSNAPPGAINAFIFESRIRGARGPQAGRTSQDRCYHQKRWRRSGLGQLYRTTRPRVTERLRLRQ